MAFTPSLCWYPDLGEAVVSMAITESACVSAAVDTRSDKVLGVPKCKHFHGRHRSDGSPYWRKNKLWAPEMILDTLKCILDFMQAAKDYILEHAVI